MNSLMATLSDPIWQIGGGHDQHGLTIESKTYRFLLTMVDISEQKEVE